MLAIDPHQPTILYAGRDNKKDFCGNGIGGPCATVYKSDDGGISWREISKGLQLIAGWMGIRSIVIHPLNPQILYVSIWSRGIFRSTDGGSSWEAFQVGLKDLNVFCLAISPTDPSRIYAATTSGVFHITQMDLPIPDGVALEPQGKLATMWAKIKQGR